MKHSIKWYPVSVLCTSMCYVLVSPVFLDTKFCIAWNSQVSENIPTCASLLSNFVLKERRGKRLTVNISNWNIFSVATQQPMKDNLLCHLINKTLTEGLKSTDQKVKKIWNTSKQVCFIDRLYNQGFVPWCTSYCQCFIEALLHICCQLV